MMQTVSKWLVTIYFGEAAATLRTSFYISDNYYNNVLTKLSQISFAEPVVSIFIEHEDSLD